MLKFTIEINLHTISVELITKSNIKHCYLRCINKDSLQIKANKLFTINDAKNLINKKQNWIIKNLNKFQESSLNSNQFYFLGKVETIFENNFNLSMYYKTCAIEIIPKLVDKHSNLMSLYPSDLKFRDNKTRWGSCSYKNSIILNINLMKFPFSVIEYVIIHELAHIQHKNHSKIFWDLVEQYCPNYKKEEKLLKQYR